jgi:PAS domain S-box-containing protein
VSDHDAKTPNSTRAADSAPAADGVAWLDAEGRIVRVNEALARLLGHARGALEAMTLADLEPEIDRDVEAGLDPGRGREAWRRLWARLEAAGAVTFEASYRHKSGASVPVEVTVFFISSDGAGSAAASVRDLSDRRRAEAALAAAKAEAERANAAKTRFLAAASHDLRQPLHAMELLVSALSGEPLSEEALSIVSDMQDSLAFTRRLLNSLLDVSELEAGTITPSFEEVPLAPLLGRIHQQYLGIAREKGLDLRLVPCSLAVRSDPGLLERIFDNLVSNAVRYTDRGRVLIGCRRRGELVRLEVWDTGPGIPESGHAKIFDDFCQLDSSAKERGAGLGLGLGLVRRLAELLGHPVRLRSAPGRGSLFWVELPLTAGQARAAPPPGRQEGEARAEAEATVMIIEDDAMVLNAMRIVLEAWGYEVVALASAEAARAAEIVPDVVIADYRLPGGETGAQAIVELRRRAGRALPGVIVTGEILPEALAEVAAQDLHVMKKPVRPAKLRALIRNLCEPR